MVVVSSNPDLKYTWPSTVNVANFVTVKPCVEGDEINNFKNWKEQMLCLLESQDVLGFVDGKILPPEEKYYKVWRRTDMLVKGWILGSVGTDMVEALQGKQTARDAWIEMDNIFNKKEEDSAGSRDFSRYLPLLQAALRGDWDAAKNFFEDINELSTTIISSTSETTLHIAVLTGKASNEFVRKLVEVMPRDALSLKDFRGGTALHNAARVGNTAAAYALVKKNPDLLHILNNYDRLPVLEATISCQKETLEYLISEHQANAEEHNKPIFEGQLGIDLLNELIYSEFVDIALDLAQRNPDLALLRSEIDNASALSTIAVMATLFPSTETFSWWQNFVYHRAPVKTPKCEVARTSDNENLGSGTSGAANKKYSTWFQIISAGGQKVESVIWHAIQNLVPEVKEVREKKETYGQALQLVEYLCNKIVSELPEKEASGIVRTSITNASKNGISVIVEMIINKYPGVVFYIDDTGRNVFQLAASCRFENVINLIYNMSDRKYSFFDTIDDENNSILHICGKLAPSARLNLVAGAALQMQRELHWFKEMEKFVHPSRRSWMNTENQSPQMIFTNEHKKLKEDGERWMKDTANAYTIAAALIATVMFAVAFTIPGGLESATGIPLFTGQGAFELFAISDAISLLTSITSLLMFVSILTSRYGEQDFLYSLPKRLSIGLFCLFVSIIFMLVAFGATFYLLLERDIWFVVLAAFACLPVTSFVLLQFPLLVHVVYSTYGPGIFGKKSDRVLH